MTQNKKKQSSGLPMAIIVLVLIVAVIGGFWFYNTSKSTSRNANRAANANTARDTKIPANAPLGAQPPNMLGSPSAAVTMEEFADFQCPSCASANPIIKQVQQAYGSRIKFIYRHFPLQMHDKAYDAALAAEAAGMQGRFWDMQNLLYTNQNTWAKSPNYRQLFVDYARSLGLDVNKFQDDMTGIAAKGRVDADFQRGRALNVSSTPSLYLNGQVVPYPYSDAMLRQLIDAELAKAASQPAGNSAAPAANAPANTAVNK